VEAQPASSAVAAAASATRPAPREVRFEVMGFSLGCRFSYTKTCRAPAAAWFAPRAGKW
jgi:hypothetical protein